MNIYEMNDYDWYAAETMEEAVQCMSETLQESIPTLLSDHEIDPKLMSNKAIDKTPFYCSETQSNITFRIELNRMTAKGHKFPSFFASTEY